MFKRINRFILCLAMNEDDKKMFLEDFKKADLQGKVDMWFYAIEQVGLWEEIIAEIADIAQQSQMKQTLKKEQ